VGAMARGLIAGGGAALALAGIRVLLFFAARLGDALGGAPEGALQRVAGRGGLWVFAAISACAGIIAAAATPPASRREPTGGLEYAIVAAASAFIYVIADTALGALR